MITPSRLFLLSSNRLMVVNSMGLGTMTGLIGSNPINQKNPNDDNTSSEINQKKLIKFIRRKLHKTSRNESFSTHAGGSRSFTNLEKEFIDKLIGFRKDIPVTYPSSDPLLYQLAVATPAKENEEKDKLLMKNNHVLPLFGTIPAAQVIKKIMEEDLHLNFSQLVLGEHYFQLYRPLPSNGKVHCIVELADVTHETAAGGTVFVFDVVTRDSDEKTLTFNQFCYNLKGFYDICSQSKRSHRCIPNITNMNEDTITHYRIACDTQYDQQATLSRIVGEVNKPNLSNSNNENEALKSLQLPMHDLLTLGIVGKKLQETLKISLEKFKGIKVKFCGTLQPEDHLMVHVWRTHQRLACFNTISTVTGQLIHGDGYLTMY